VYVSVGLAGEIVPLEGTELGFTPEAGGGSGFDLAAKLNVARRTPIEQSSIAKRLRRLIKPDLGVGLVCMELLL
jgi:hypothetical protein